MRMNLIAKPTTSFWQGFGSVPLSLTLRPACGLPGDYEYVTDSASLLSLLQRQTELPSSVLERFDSSARKPTGGRLLGVELSERVLTDIGYFVD
jgi:hypothetical protein